MGLVLRTSAAAAGLEVPPPAIRPKAVGHRWDRLCCSNISAHKGGGGRNRRNISSNTRKSRDIDGI